MNDAMALRFAALEERLAYQERSQEQLSDALAAARAEVDRLTLRLLRVEAQLRESAASYAPADAAADEPPPHY